jgi:hypothetical protein
LAAQASKKGKITTLLLLLSAVLGISILATDQNLWQYQPSHAYSLILFVAIDLGLGGLTLRIGTKPILRAAAGWGFLQALIMLGDIFWPMPFGNIPLTQSDFATYLFGLGFYDSKHIAFLFPTLFVVLLVLAGAAFWESRKAPNSRNRETV